LLVFVLSNEVVQSMANYESERGMICFRDGFQLFSLSIAQ